MLSHMSGLFTTGPLYNSHFCISKILKETVMTYLPPDTILTNMGHTPNKWKRLIQVRKATLRECKAIVKEVEKDGGGTGLRSSFLEVICRLS